MRISTTTLYAVYCAGSQNWTSSVFRMLAFPGRMTQPYLSGLHEKGVYCSHMTLQPSRDMLMNAFRRLNPCRGYLKSVVLFQLVVL